MSTPELKELLRNRILVLAATGQRRGMNLNGFSVGIEVSGFTLKGEDLATELDYLTNKGFLDRTAAVVSAGLERYSLTASGREYLEANGLLDE